MHYHSTEISIFKLLVLQWEVNLDQAMPAFSLDIKNTSSGILTTAQYLALSRGTWMTSSVLLHYRSKLCRISLILQTTSQLSSLHTTSLNKVCPFLTSYSRLKMTPLPLLSTIQTQMQAASWTRTHPIKINPINPFLTPSHLLPPRRFSKQMQLYHSSIISINLIIQIK